MIRTKLTERYGIETPFVSAGMGLIALPALAAAVSNAGGLGQLASGGAPPHALREMIAATRQRTDRPFGVNFIIETTAFGPPGDNLIDAAGVEIFNAGHHPTSLSRYSRWRL